MCALLSGCFTTMTQTCVLSAVFGSHKKSSAFHSHPQRTCQFTSTISNKSYDRRKNKITNIEPNRSDRVVYGACSAHRTDSRGFQPKPPPILPNMWIEKAQLPYWPLYSQQVSHQRWIWGSHKWDSMQKWSTLGLKPRADITRSPKQGYQWSHEKDLCHPKFLKKKNKININLSIVVIIYVIYIMWIVEWNEWQTIQLPVSPLIDEGQFPSSCCNKGNSTNMIPSLTTLCYQSRLFNYYWRF